LRTAIPGGRESEVEKTWRESRREVPPLQA
jgi:hypothetical protein